uniref:Neurofilament heavy polypeptide n=1 Tax=Rhipicephalus zambeziensis TaxID=60191 RepID=A0A224YP75_9ACAR
MSEHGKEVQPIIVVVEENSENVVVQAFSRDSEAAGDESAFTVNQLDNAISAALPEQLTGVETITTSEGQQLLILSQDANGKLVSMEGTQVEHSAAVLDTRSSCHEVSKGNVAEQCAASPESSQMELQQECKMLSEENGSSEVNAIPDNVNVPEESAECEYESESKPRKATPIGVSKSSKTSSSDVPVTLGQGDSSECWEKPASPCREPVQVTEEKKNGIMDMNVNDNHSSDMTVPSVQSIKPGTEVHLNTFKMPSAPLVVGEKLDTADMLDADKYTKEDSPCAVWDSKSSETAGNTLEVSECQGQGERVQSMDDVCASQTSSNHFIIDTTTNPLLGKNNDKSLPVVAEHSEVSSKESLKVGQNTKVCSKRASQSANVEQQNEPLSQIIRCSSDSATVTGPLHKSLEPEASKHSVILRADAVGVAKSRVGHPPQYQTKGNASIKNVSILKPQACSTFASSFSEASSALHKEQESLKEKEGTKCTRYCAVEDEKSASHPVSTAVESLESRYEHADFNIESLPANPEELSQTSHSAVVLNIDKPEEESTSAKLCCAHQNTNKPGQISLKGETLKVQPAASILSSNVITDNEKAKSQLIEKDNPLTELCDVLKENSQSTLDLQTKSIQKEEAFQLSQVKTLHEMPKKQSDKMTLIPVTSSYAESKLQGSPHNESHKASQKRESESVQEAPSGATFVADQGSQPNMTKEHCEVQPQASSELDTEENKLQKETTDSIDIPPGKPADNIEMHISKCHDSKNFSEHSARRDDVGQLQELHDSEHQGKDACEKTEIRAKAFNQDIQEQVEEGLTTVTDTNITNVPETYTSLEKGGVKSSAKGPPTDKLLAALDLVPRPPDGSAKEQDVTAEEPCPACATSDLGNGETKPENECLDEQEGDTPSKKRWSLRTPTKPRKRVIIPDSDDEDFEAYVSEDVQPVTQKSKSEEAFDVLLDFFKKEQAQKAAVETVAMRKKSARKVGRVPSKSSSARSRSSNANSIPFEKESAVKTAKVKDVVKPTVRKSQPVHTSCTTSQATAVKQARKRRSEPVKVVPHKKSVGDGAGSRIRSMSDTFAGDIRIRCQKPNSSMDKMTSRYHCSKCGFRSARMENIVRHHKQDCPYSKQQPAWDSKALKSTSSALA